MTAALWKLQTVIPRHSLLTKKPFDLIKFCLKKSIGFIKVKIITVSFLGLKKFHHSNKEEAVFSKNLMGFWLKILVMIADLADYNYLSDRQITDSNIKRTINH